MDTEALTGMMLSSGMAKSREQAAAMAGQMKSMSPAQMEMMKKAAKVGAAGLLGCWAAGLLGCWAAGCNASDACDAVPMTPAAHPRCVGRASPSWPPARPARNSLPFPRPATRR
jgi:hypothetical protein